MTMQDKLRRRDRYMSGWTQGIRGTPASDQDRSDPEFQQGLRRGAEDLGGIEVDGLDETKTASYAQGWRGAILGPLDEQRRQRDQAYANGAAAGVRARENAGRAANKFYVTD